MQRREKELYAYFLGIHMYTLPDFFSIQIIFACCRLIEVRSPNWFLSYPGLKSRFFDKSFNICRSFCSHNFSQSPFIDKIIGTFARSNRFFIYLPRLFMEAKEMKCFVDFAKSHFLFRQQDSDCG